MSTTAPGAATGSTGSDAPAKYVMGEIVSAKVIAEKLAAGEIPEDTPVSLPRGRVTATSKEEAIGILAARDDREGTRYSAQTERFYLERTPKKSIRWA